MKWGIDVSEHNGSIPWRALKRGGLSFAIVRLGWGQVHLDELFYENINGALAAGIEVGIYYYSYALTMEAAAREARFTAFVLRDCGLSLSRLSMGCWLDMEDADRYKEKNGLTDGQAITAISASFLEEMKKEGYPCGIYGSWDWLTHKIHVPSLPPGTPVWCAQWGRECSYPGASLWQFTNALRLEGMELDGDICMD
ncbi:GH25 family lysozyme [uncultured Dialister sp.]|jgi:lysozyme|uniref:GH25 family lysozyme n=1 Tax=uncultured Dialister sp. TaxID=278064 RepID=UPI0025E64A08|nr:GH25 family lysozyme [uncultured Dialister sp.]